MSVTQYALTNTFDIWQEDIENLGWSQADVEDILDEERYLGVPELLSRELEFRSQAENREEFLQILATGGYRKQSPRNGILVDSNMSIVLHAKLDLELLILSRAWIS
ncbi:unnamed protein product [Sphagnum balticum]